MLIAVFALCRRRLFAAELMAMGLPLTDFKKGPLNVVPMGTNWRQSERNIVPKDFAFKLVVKTLTSFFAVSADADVQMSENCMLTATAEMGVTEADVDNVAVGVSVHDGEPDAEPVADELEPVLIDDVADAAGDGVPVGVEESDAKTEGVCVEVDDRDGVVDPLGVPDGLEPELSDDVGVLVAVGDCDADDVTEAVGVDVPVSSALVLADGFELCDTVDVLDSPVVGVEVDDGFELCDADGLGVLVSVPEGVGETLGVPEGVGCGVPDTVGETDGGAPDELVVVGVGGIDWLRDTVGARLVVLVAVGVTVGDTADEPVRVGEPPPSVSVGVAVEIDELPADDVPLLERVGDGVKVVEAVLLGVSVIDDVEDGDAPVGNDGVPDGERVFETVPDDVIERVLDTVAEGVGVLDRLAPKLKVLVAVIVAVFVAVNVAVLVLEGDDVGEIVCASPHAKSDNIAKSNIRTRGARLRITAWAVWKGTKNRKGTGTVCGENLAAATFV